MWRVPVVALLLALPARADEAARFYFSGDGALRMAHAHLAETLDVRYRDADGRYDDAALAAIARFFRSRTDGRSGPLSLRLIELLDYLEDRYRPRRLTLVSGYRSPELNAALRAGGRRVAQASMHTEGLAADVQPAGLDLRRLWNALRRDQPGGVGLYQAEGFLHLDTGRPRFWEAATSKVDQNLAKENARLFARTDFDRYDTLAGAVIGLHSVTALPIAVRAQARIGDQRLTLAARAGGARADGDCWVFTEPADRYELAVSSTAAPPARREPIVLDTCDPRIGATPAEVLTNPVERRGSSHVIGGELVPLSGSPGRFRLVGHDGAFTAPAGTPLDALDGKAVTIELSADGRVTRIAEQPVAITPRTTGRETVRGQLVVRDAAAGTFAIAGMDGVYAAPPGLDLAPYGGRWVEVILDAAGRVQHLVVVADHPPPAP
jgi:uncharacterized protein YcbK (DUF882 family)